MTRTESRELVTTAVVLPRNWDAVTDDINELISRWINWSYDCARRVHPEDKLPDGWDRDVVTAEDPIIPDLTKKLIASANVLEEIKAIVPLQSIGKDASAAREAARQVLICSVTSPDRVERTVRDQFGYRSANHVREFLKGICGNYRGLADLVKKAREFEAATAQAKTDRDRDIKMGLWPEDGRFTIHNFVTQLQHKGHAKDGFGRFFSRPLVKEILSHFERIGMRVGSWWLDRLHSDPETALNGWILDNTTKKLDEIRSDPLEFLLCLLEVVLNEGVGRDKAYHRAWRKSVDSNLPVRSDVTLIDYEATRLVNGARPDHSIEIDDTPLLPSAVRSNKSDAKISTESASIDVLRALLSGEHFDPDDGSFRDNRPALHLSDVTSAIRKPGWSRLNVSRFFNQIFEGGHKTYVKLLKDDHRQLKRILDDTGLSSLPRTDGNELVSIATTRR